jgi:hypothetical protein
MGHRSCSLRPESARGRVMMAPLVDVGGLHPRLGGSSSEAEVESVFRGRGQVRAPGSGEAEFVVF